MLSSLRELADWEFTMIVGNEAKVSAIAIGAVCLELENKFLILNNVFYILNFHKKLISVSRLHEQMFEISII